MMGALSTSNSESTGSAAAFNDSIRRAEHR